MQKNLFIAAIVCLLSLSLQAAKKTENKNSINLFGTTFQWVTEDAEASDKVNSFIQDIKNKTSQFDPDCYYSKTNLCPKAVDNIYTTELDKLSAEFGTETGGAFDVAVTQDGKKYRDFGGVAQGYVLSKLISEKLKGSYLLNFSGDIYVSGEFSKRPQLKIGVPRRDEIAFARVSMKQGWMLGSSAPKFGSKIRIPPNNSKFSNQFDFKKIVLFAKSDFNGARLDAWSTALIVGGKKLLEEIKNNKQYAGQWGYIFIDNADKTECSTNLKCTISSNLATNFIQVPW